MKQNTPPQKIKKKNKTKQEVSLKILLAFAEEQVRTGVVLYLHLSVHLAIVDLTSPTASLEKLAIPSQIPIWPLAQKTLFSR